MPTRLDVWVATLLAKCLARQPLFDLIVQSGIHHNVLGGFAYAMALFVFWVYGGRPGQEAVRRRMLTIFIGSLIASGLTLAAGRLVAWQPPAHYPGLAFLYSQYMGENANFNSFPSQSTALYAAVSAGIYSVDRFVGGLLWAGILLLVALPRMYVGGHWFTDVVVGLVLGLAGFAGARYSLESTLVPQAERVFDGRNRLRTLGEVLVFAWILQVALEFRDVVWVVGSLKYLLKM